MATQSYARSFELLVAHEGSENATGLPWQLAAVAVVYPATPAVDDMIRPHMRFGMNNPRYPPDVEFATFVPQWFRAARHHEPGLRRDP